MKILMVVVLLYTLFGIPLPPLYRIPGGEFPIDISPDPIPVKPLESPTNATTR